jgi:hypothetical protein
MQHPSTPSEEKIVFTNLNMSFWLGMLVSWDHLEQIVHAFNMPTDKYIFNCFVIILGLFLVIRSIYYLYSFRLWSHFGLRKYFFDKS